MSKKTITMQDYDNINPLPSEQVKDFLECLARETDIHRQLRADVLPAPEGASAQDTGRETARVISNFILAYLVRNNLRIKGKSFAEIGMGQLRRAASDWAIENLTDLDVIDKGTSE